MNKYNKRDTAVTVMGRGSRHGPGGGVAHGEGRLVSVGEISETAEWAGVGVALEGSPVEGDRTEPRLGRKTEVVEGMLLRGAVRRVGERGWELGELSDIFPC